MPDLDTYSGKLSEYEAKEVLRNAGIPTVKEHLATSVEEAVEYADQVGYPVMMKVDSPDVQHKSDIGAVKDAHDEDEVRNRYDLIKQNVEEHDPDADVDGILIEERVSGKELIVGVNKDPDFGHVIMFGLGGIFVEVLHDVNFRAIPITEADAHDLINDMRSRELLDGVRGEPPVDTDGIVDVLLHVSQLIEEHPEIAELDINPLFANEDGAIAVDALIALEDA